MNLLHLLSIIPTGLVILFVASAMITGVIEAIRTPKPCERCGQTPGKDTGPWRPPS